MARKPTLSRNAEATPGYSGTPLAAKLGYKPPLRVWLVDAPPEYMTWLPGLADGVEFTTRAPRLVAAAHVFSSSRATLQPQLVRLRSALASDGFVWISWPKQTAKMATDVNGDVIRELALPLGFVDIKVCAVSAVWSGLKLVIRKSERAR